MAQPDDLLDSAETAALLGIKKNTLETWRGQGRGPAFIKFGNTARAAVRYQRAEVMAWIARNRFASTSAYTVAAQRPGALRGPWETPRPAVRQPGEASE